MQMPGLLKGPTMSETGPSFSSCNEGESLMSTLRNGSVTLTYSENDYFTKISIYTKMYHIYIQKYSFIL